jgi:hypothetical protein
METSESTLVLLLEVQRLLRQLVGLLLAGESGATYGNVSLERGSLECNVFGESDTSVLATQRWIAAQKAISVDLCAF